MKIFAYIIISLIFVAKSMDKNQQLKLLDDTIKLLESSKDEFLASCSKKIKRGEDFRRKMRNVVNNCNTLKKENKSLFI